MTMDWWRVRVGLLRWTPRHGGAIAGLPAEERKGASSIPRGTGSREEAVDVLEVVRSFLVSRRFVAGVTAAAVCSSRARPHRSGA